MSKRKWVVAASCVVLAGLAWLITRPSTTAEPAPEPEADASPPPPTPEDSPRKSSPHVRRPARKPRPEELAARRVTTEFDGGWWDGHLFGPDPHHLPKPHRSAATRDQVLAVAEACRDFCGTWSSVRPDAACPYPHHPVRPDDGFLTGHVVHPDGTLANQGEVYFSSQSADGPDKFGLVDFFNGSYATWLAPGDYLIYAFIHQGPQEANAPRLSGRNMVSATITSGEVTELDLRANDETAHIEAVLMGVNGPVSGGRLIVDGIFRGELQSANGPLSDATGHIEIMVTAGEHLIGAWGPGYAITLTPVNLLPDEVEDMGVVPLSPN